MASTSTAPVLTHCRKCNKDFPTFDAYHKHKLKSANHITCDVCSQDFATHEARKLHHDQLHSQEQNLKCPGCHKRFQRLGGLISHIELTECNAIAKKTFDTAVKEKSAWERNYEAVRGHQGSVMGTSNGPNPFAVRSTTTMTANAFQLPSAPEPEPEPEPEPATYQEDNLISFDEPSSILNSGWGLAPTPAPTFGKNDFPALGSAPTQAKGKENVQPTPQASTAASLNLAERVMTMTIDDTPANPFDPDSPGFSIQTYWIPMFGKYKCPYRGCNKSIERPNAFIQHLKSPAHRNEKLQCNSCLRYYATATALTQHSESQGVRCKVRETENYGGIVDSITGGTAIIAGLHKDDTIKYGLTPGMTGNVAEDIIAANRAQAKALEEARKNHWTKHKPFW